MKRYPILKVLVSQVADNIINMCLLNQVIIDWEPF